MIVDAFYVYEHWRSDRNLPFYVGKGRADRAYEDERRRNSYYKKIIGKLKKIGATVTVRIVFNYLDETTAFLLEKSQISYWKSHGITLVNQTDGGEGISGFKHKNLQYRKSDSYSKILSEAQKRYLTKVPEAKAKRAAHLLSFVHDPQHKERRSNRLKELWNCPKERQKRIDAIRRSKLKKETV